MLINEQFSTKLAFPPHVRRLKFPELFIRIVYQLVRAAINNTWRLKTLILNCADWRVKNEQRIFSVRLAECLCLLQGLIGFTVDLTGELGV